MNADHFHGATLGCWYIYILHTLMDLHVLHTCFHQRFNDFTIILWLEDRQFSIFQLLCQIHLFLKTKFVKHALSLKRRHWGPAYLRALVHEQILQYRLAPSKKYQQSVHNRCARCNLYNTFTILLQYYNNIFTILLQYFCNTFTILISQNTL